ncbi:hypothetical protein [Brevibacillus sp. H7]|uniref:hypothetical protein n=1 Tax=Brevibacillus sp. H7 TaxID=3349138 RepID=UPI003819193C
MKVSFDMYLPFKLPIKDGIKSIHAYPNAEFMLTYQSYKRGSVIDHKYLLDEIDCTVVKIDYMPHESITKGLQKDELLRLTVVDSIDFLNLFFDALRINHGLSHVRNITIADLPVTFSIVINDEEAFEYLSRPHDVITPSSQLSLEDLSKVGSSLQMWDAYPEVFLFEKFFATAKSHLHREQMIEAIIDLQTSFEIFIRNTHKLLLLHKNASEEEIYRAQSIPFRNVVEDHIGRMLEANLKFNETTGPISVWYEKLYKVRNEIVHSGRVHISGNEAYDAFDAYVNARNYIADLLLDAGLMNSNHKVDLSIFPKNIKGSIDPQPILEKLKQQGMIPKDLQFYNSAVDSDTNRVSD